MLLPYTTVLQESEDAFEVKRSRFLCHVCPVTDVPQAQAFISRVRTDHWDARHNVSAYSLRSGQQHCTDDGEPQGTAGRPVLGVILSKDVRDVCVVITRYFGGVLLGTGGLVRAYSHGAELALEAGNPVRMVSFQCGRLSCEYALYAKINALVNQFHGTVDGTDFGADVTLTAALPSDSTERFSAALSDLSSDRCHMTVLGEEYRAGSASAQDK